VRWGELLSAGFLATSLGGGLRLAAPVLVSSLGGAVSERAGVLNLSLEGTMYLGGLTSFLTVAAGGSWPLGLLVGFATGAVLGVVHGLFSIRLRCDQVVTGVALTIFGEGAAQYFHILRYGDGSGAPRIDPLPRWRVPLLARIPTFGDAVFDQQVLVYLGLVLAVATHVLLFRTNWGLRVRAAGDAPDALGAVGHRVGWLRLQALVLGTGLAGVGGAFLIVGETRSFDTGVVAGRGWLAVGIVILAGWRPLWCIPASFLFGFVDAAQLRLQLVEVPVSPEFLLMLPVAAVLVSLVVRRRRVAVPLALGRPYEP
jgi:general nucleoside transport system permease protein